MTNRGERLRNARQKVFKSARQAAFALGVPVATYNAHEHAQQPGGRDYSPEEAQTYARHFGTRTEFLLMGVVSPAAPPHGPLIVPLVGRVNVNDEVQFYPADKVQQVPAFPQGSTYKTTALELRNKDDFDHWLAFYDDLREPPTPQLFGQVCIVETSGGRVFMRRIQRSGRRGFVHLVSRNSDPITDVRVHWAALVHTIRYPRSRGQL